MASVTRQVYSVDGMAASKGDVISKILKTVAAAIGTEIGKGGLKNDVIGSISGEHHVYKTRRAPPIAHVARISRDSMRRCFGRNNGVAGGEMKASAAVAKGGMGIRGEAVKVMAAIAASGRSAERATISAAWQQHNEK